MPQFRFLPLAAALFAASTLIACNTAPSMPMASAAAQGMATPDHMGKMDAQMKKMRDMHDKMTAAKTPEDRSKLMAEHMKTMQDSMQMMGNMQGMGDMKGMSGMSGDMAAHHQMMDKRMAMMESMMQMMMDRMLAPPAR